MPKARGIESPSISRVAVDLTQAGAANELRMREKCAIMWIVDCAFDKEHKYRIYVQVELTQHMHLFITIKCSMHAPRGAHFCLHDILI